MKKKLLNLALCAFISSIAFAQQTPVPVTNYSFEDPAYTGKISDGLGIPGWAWDGTVADAGRESAKLRTADDSLHAYVHNQDPKMYQVLNEVIGTSSVTYKLNYLGYADWTSSEAAVMRTYFGAKNGGAITILDSTDNDLTGYTWLLLSHTFTLPLNSAHAGDSLVIGFNIVIPTATNGAWGDIDSVTVSKSVVSDVVSVTNYSFEDPAYTGKISNGLGIPGWAWDGTVADAGRESAKLRTADDSLHAYVHNQDPKMYQVLNEVIGASSVSYKLSYLGYADWTSSEAAVMRTYFGAKNGGAITLLDSTDNDLTGYTWLPLSHTFTLPLNSANVGDSLVIGFNIVIPTATNGAWGDIDSVTLSKSLVAEEVSVTNYSFEDPAYTGKISNGLGIPGWAWDGTVADAGRESAKLRSADDSLHAYVHNQDPKMYQVLNEVIGTTSYTYKLDYLGYADWTSSEAAVMRTYFGAKNGGAITILDSVDNDLTAYTWMPLSHTFTLPMNSANVGDSLVIGFNIVIPTATNGAWGDIDSVTLKKVYSTKPAEPEWSTFPIANVLDGKHLPADFKADVKMRWDASNIYASITVKDDTIMHSMSSSQNIWDVDNVELYFDMTNGKIVNWPRDNGWPPAYTNGTDGYWQLRVVPDSLFTGHAQDGSLMNPSKLQGVGLTYNRNTADSTYTFDLVFPFDSLLNGFTPKIGDTIGCDINVSDNNNNPYYRNQVSLNSPLKSLYCDPASWASLQLVKGGLFKAIPDVTKPSSISNLLGDTTKATDTSATVKLTWDAATDNIVVQSYIIARGTTNLDTILAKKTGNSFTIVLKDSGQINFGVTAVDLYGNKSLKILKKVHVAFRTNTGIKPYSLASFKVSPNPAYDVINIVSPEVIQTVDVISLIGQTVQTSDFNNSTDVRLSVAGLQNGIYLVRVRTASGISVQRIVKQ